MGFAYCYEYPIEIFVACTVEGQVSRDDECYLSYPSGSEILMSKVGYQKSYSCRSLIHIFKLYPILLSSESTIIPVF